jgi:hypothetical protein
MKSQENYTLNTGSNRDSERESLHNQNLFSNVGNEVI